MFIINESHNINTFRYWLLIEGASVNIFLHPEGNDSGDFVLQGACIVTGNSTSVTMDDTIRQSISVQGTGGITRTTV